MTLFSFFPYRGGTKKKKEAPNRWIMPTWTRYIDTPLSDPSPNGRMSLQCLTLGAVAQMGEHLPCTQGVVGSNPIRSIPRRIICASLATTANSLTSRFACHCVAV